MAGQDKAPAPVTPSDETERPEGLAFDVEKGADLSGVPTGDQTPANPEAAGTEEAVRETGEVPPAAAAVPGDQTQGAEKLPDDEERGER